MFVGRRRQKSAEAFCCGSAAAITHINQLLTADQRHEKEARKTLLIKKELEWLHVSLLVRTQEACFAPTTPGSYILLLLFFFFFCHLKSKIQFSSPTISERWNFLQSKLPTEAKYDIVSQLKVVALTLKQTDSLHFSRQS